MNIKPRAPIKTSQINVRVPDELKVWLERYAENVGTSQADLIFQLLNNIKETQEQAG